MTKSEKTAFRLRQLISSLVVYSYLAPFAIFGLMSRKSVWYGEGLGRFGGLAILILYASGMASAMIGILHRNVLFRSLAILASVLYIWGLVVQLF
ncbi:MAG: hypothetical protein Aurels2KO_22660 [Aureliella sp.]